MDFAVSSWHFEFRSDMIKNKIEQSSNFIQRPIEFFYSNIYGIGTSAFFMAYNR